ncbi:MAG: YcxB family protein [Brevundimonas sp.]|uniref:YcxB-like C-terminal domain-containing protein n=1 Tax=Brevundimonas mediterranea TaxID=74329 RepID=A0A7W6A3L9_9CAUL|nr:MULTISPECIES: YcxB family protein [Brevundimonas]MBB3871175.1 hypothetical protein [Brevundimonas mediterranea]MDK2746128.1 YcxB family protein [Brevundimonas sp.]
MPSVVYALRRDEIWHWYKKAWRRSLWPFHAFLLVMPLGLICLLRREMDVASIVEGGMLGILACGVMIAYPQMRYRSEVRTLILDERGVRGVRGKTDYFVEWAKIARVEQQDGYLVITERKLNAFIIPMRAFASEEEKAAFLDFAENRISQGI